MLPADGAHYEIRSTHMRRRGPRRGTLYFKRLCSGRRVRGEIKYKEVTVIRDCYLRDPREEGNLIV